MVTQLPNEERWEAVEVQDVQEEYKGDVIADRNGNLQYRISCKFSWSQYPVYVYVYRDNCPNPFNVGSYNALVKRGSLQPKHNNEADPTEYMFKHFIVQWESIGQPAPAPAPAPAPQAPVVAEREPTPMETGASIIAKSKPVADIFAGIDQNQMRIMRQATLKCASWLMVPVSRETLGVSTDDFDTSWVAKWTEELSELFLEYVVTGKVYEDIPEDAEDLLNEDPFA